MIDDEVKAMYRLFAVFCAITVSAMFIFLSQGCSNEGTSALDGGAENEQDLGKNEQDLGKNEQDLGKSEQDLAQSEQDLAQAHAQDLSQALACGHFGEPCCENEVCGEGSCMRQTSTANLRCVQVVFSCGGFHQECCTIDGATTHSLAGYCPRDPNAANNGNSLGWYRCFSYGCAP